jgi:hypothetical protein
MTNDQKQLWKIAKDKDISDGKQFTPRQQEFVALHYRWKR